jgi:hypothetical protein
VVLHHHLPLHNCLIARVSFMTMIQTTRRAYLQVYVVEAPVSLSEVVGILQPLAPSRKFRRGAGLLAIGPSFDPSHRPSPTPPCGIQSPLLRIELFSALGVNRSFVYECSSNLAGATLRTTPWVACESTQFQHHPRKQHPRKQPCLPS